MLKSCVQNPIKSFRLIENICMKGCVRYDNKELIRHIQILLILKKKKGGGSTSLRVLCMLAQTWHSRGRGRKAGRSRPDSAIQ